MPTGQVLILVVEDDADLRALICRHVRACGYSTAEAGSVAEALDFCRGARPNLVLLDINLPDGSGWEVARALQNTGETPVPIVVCSSAAPPWEGVYDGPVAGFVSKPFTARALVEAVQGALANPAGESVAPPAAAPADGSDRDAEAAFFASLAHDLRTPMATFRTALESLLSSDVEWDRETQREFLAVV
ncbi:MAG: response regulator, partial [Armatimonadota bacterium]|nr:response regulator [Armatimonadota bacterium]